VSEGKGRRNKMRVRVEDNAPRIQAVPPQRFGRHETSDSSVSKGATRRVARKTQVLTIEPGADEYGYSVVECWVAEVGQTHL